MDDLKEKLKVQVIEHLNLEDMQPSDIPNDEPLFGEGLGLDSIDALELIVMLEKHYGLKVTNPEDGRRVFYTIDTMADYIKEHTS
ncbi:MAG: acyl carrier protein [Flavobacteriales bacterium]|nr:acyl carrier protein [Flavobacteriales bacterium]